MCVYAVAETSKHNTTLWNDPFGNRTKAQPTKYIWLSLTVLEHIVKIMIES